MSWSKYAEFLTFAVVLVLIPGPGFAGVAYLVYLGVQAIRSAVWAARTLLRSAQMILIWLVGGGHNGVCC